MYVCVKMDDIFAALSTGIRFDTKKLKKDSQLFQSNASNGLLSSTFCVFFLVRSAFCRRDLYDLEDAVLNFIYTDFVENCLIVHFVRYCDLFTYMY